MMETSQWGWGFRAGLGVGAGPGGSRTYKLLQQANKSEYTCRYDIRAASIQNKVPTFLYKRHNNIKVWD